jgi:hypothetical protein
LGRSHARAAIGRDETPREEAEEAEMRTDQRSESPARTPT